MWIYKIINLVNNKKYIGQTRRSVEDRWRDHCTLTKSKHKSLIRLAIAKYGQDAFKIEIIETCVSIDELNIKEQIHILSHNALSPNGYNLDLGGKSKIVHLETRKKMALAKIGKPSIHTIESRKKLSKARMGMKFSKSHCDRLSAVRKDKKLVKCVENNTIYESYSAAAKALNIPVQRVSQCANGRRKSAYGFHFEAINGK